VGEYHNEALEKRLSHVQAIAGDCRDIGPREVSGQTRERSPTRSNLRLVFAMLDALLVVLPRSTFISHGVVVALLGIYLQRQSIPSLRQQLIGCSASPRLRLINWSQSFVLPLSATAQAYSREKI
jgi:hypothetical protein